MRNMSNIDVLRGYRAHLQAAGRAHGTILLRTSHIRRMIAHCNMPVSYITQADLEAWLSAHEWSAAARASARASLRNFFQWAVDNGYVTHDSSAGLPAVARPRGVPRPMPDPLVTDSIRETSGHIRLAIELMACVGLRRGEVARIRSSDVEARGRGWVIRVTGKGGHTRVVPIPPHLARRIRSAHGWVFPGGDGGHISAGWLGKQINRSLPPGWTCHKLRHRFASVAYSSGRDLRAGQELLGHASVATTQIYTAVDGAHLVHAASAAWSVAA